MRRSRRYSAMWWSRSIDDDGLTITAQRCGGAGEGTFAGRIDGLADAKGAGG